MTSTHYLVFSLDDQSYALCIEAVDRVLRSVQLTRVPEAPEILVGLLNLRGTIVPVLDIRRRFNLPPRELSIEDRMIVCETSSRPIAVIVDRVDGVFEFGEEGMLEGGKILPNMEERVEGVGITRNHTVLIYDIDRLFSLDDIRSLNIDGG